MKKTMALTALAAVTLMGVATTPASAAPRFPDPPLTPPSLMVPATGDTVGDDGAQLLRTEPVPFTVRTVEDAALPVGIQVTIQEGVNGVRSYYETDTQVKDAQGNFILVPVYSDAITTLPTEQVVRQGTNAEVIQGVSQKTLDLEAKKKADEAKRKADEEAQKAAQAAAASNGSKGTKKTSSQAADTPVSSDTSNGTVTSAEENKAYARSILSASDFQCINTLAMRESGWKTTATNPTSGAYGVPQSLPASKLASAGADWRTNGKTQVNWMISYVNQRYGSACAAVSFWNQNHWY